MRSLMTFGIIAGFISMAFTTPSEATVSAREAIAKTQISSTATKALFSGSSVSADEMRKAAKLMEAMAKDPSLALYAGSLSSVVGVDRPTDLLHRTAKFLAGATPTTKKIIASTPAVTNSLVPRSKEWKSLLFSEKDSFLKDSYETIDWAQRKGDQSHCKEFDPSLSTKRSAGPTVGDLLALCLAKVNGDGARCFQIDVITAPTLKKVCETELVT